MKIKTILIIQIINLIMQLANLFLLYESYPYLSIIISSVSLIISFAAVAAAAVAVGAVAAGAAVGAGAAVAAGAAVGAVAAVGAAAVAAAVAAALQEEKEIKDNAHTSIKESSIEEKGKELAVEKEGDGGGD
jgi:hypothetical protein